MLSKTVFRLMSISVSVLVMVVALGGQLGAQTTSGTISGTLVDQSGAVVPGAEVVLTSEATSAARTVTTSDTGEFISAGRRASLPRSKIGSSSRV